MLTPPSASARLAHVLRHLDAICTIPEEARPGYDELAPVRLPPPTDAAEDFFHGTEPLPSPQSEVQWLHHGHERMPLLFDGDLVGSIFFWLSGWQEVYTTERDQFGRFPYAASLQARLGCVGLPVADMLLEALRKWLEDVSGQLLPLHPPAPRLAVSHDVDHLLGGWRGAAGRHWRSGNRWAALLAAGRHLLGRRDPFDNLTEVAKIVRDETGLASTFYFLGARGKHALGPNADYDLASAGVQNRIRALEMLGCAVGLHGSFGTATQAEQLRAELDKLPHLTAGVRFHYLCFDPIRTPDVLLQAGATHDATLGFAERAGFRHGTARPFWLYDFQRQRTHRIICHPLHAMDVTFANPAYQFTPAPDIPAQIAVIARAARLGGGTFSLLWHNEYVVPGEETLGEETLRAVLRAAMAD
jgi:hypothetical protein